MLIISFLSTSTTSQSSLCQEYYGDNICDDTPEKCGNAYVQGVSITCNECSTGGYDCNKSLPKEGPDSPLCKAYYGDNICDDSKKKCGNDYKVDKNGNPISLSSCQECSTGGFACSAVSKPATGPESPVCQTYGSSSDPYCDDTKENCASGYVEGISDLSCKECSTGKWKDCKIAPKPTPPKIFESTNHRIFITYTDESLVLRVAKSFNGGSSWYFSDLTQETENIGKLSSIDAIGDTLFVVYYDLEIGNFIFQRNAAPTIIDRGVYKGDYLSFVPSAFSAIDAIDLDNIFVSYYDIKNEQLKFSKSVDGGKSWSTPKIIESGAASYSSISAVDANTVFVVYKNKDTKLTVAKSTDDGKSWGFSDVVKNIYSTYYPSLKVIHLKDGTT